ncbi:MAG: protein kinase domain-containing protein, partial [Solirubrobacteraceae bacterium]
MRPEPGTTLADGRYSLRRRLGAGGMASVWLADDLRLERTVAVKIVADTIAGDERWVQRFKREARAAAALSHRGVVSVFDYGVQEGRPYLVMEYVAGGTLAERLSSGRAPDLPDARTVAEELLDALRAVHAAGIVHRDIKPANLLLDDHGHVRLTDFGIALPDGAAGLTTTGLVIGTLRYLAPEVAAGQPASVQSDLYAAGVVLSQLAEQPPAPGLAEQPSAPGFAALVSALTAARPGDRPASAAAAIELLRDAETAPTQPTPSETAPRQPAPTRTDATRPVPARTAVMQPAPAKPVPPQPGGAGALAGDVARTVVSLARRLHRSLAPPLRRRGVAPGLAYGAIGIAAAIVIAAIVLTL